MPHILIYVAVALGGLVVSAVENRVRKTKLKIAVIGPEEGGKTTFVNLLQEGKVKADPYKMTALEASVPEFEAYWTKNNKHKRTDISVNSDVNFVEKMKDFIPGKRYGGKDIPGDKGLMSDYKKILDGKDFSFFFFNIERYFHEENYQKDVNTRFDFLDSYLHPKNLIIVATHIDKVNQDINGISYRLKNMVKDKPYVGVLKNVKYINLLDDNAGDEMRKCFGKYGES